MKDIISSFPLALKMIFKDPINLLLSVIPTLMALTLYLFTIGYVFQNSEKFIGLFQGYAYGDEGASFFAKILTAAIIIFIFFLMSWTFVVVVGIISAPFNSLLSARIEDKLLLHELDLTNKEAFKKIRLSLFGTFKNELKKLVFICLLGVLAFFLNLFPLLYPVGLFLFSVLIAVQFIDYSWSRHGMHFSGCFGEMMANLFSYAIAGFFFLLLVTVPIINAFIPALATSYFTVLWLKRANRIP